MSHLPSDTFFRFTIPMEISYGCVYKRSSKPVIKGSRVETIEDARKEYKQLLEEGWKKTSIYKNAIITYFISIY